MGINKSAGPNLHLNRSSGIVWRLFVLVARDAEHSVGVEK